MPGVKRFTLARFNAASLAAFTIALSIIVGCERHRDIVGKWRLEGGAGETVWEFSRNGSVLVGNTRGRYRFGDQGRIKVETTFAQAAYVFEIAAKRMTIVLHVE